MTGVTTPSSIYGPVSSWRLGSSLGVDLLCIDSICSFGCVYCQLGKINRVTKKREVFISTEKILEDLKRSDWQKADVITFSGSGEPSLALNLGEAIEKIREFTGKPIAVLTNSSLLGSKKVRAEISLADKIFCKLDGWSDEMLRRIDRPAEGISLNSIITGIRCLRREYMGFLAIQTMILRMPKEPEMRRFAEILKSIEPDEIQLNLPTRPIPHQYLPESRGNSLEIAQGSTRLKRITAPDLEGIRKALADLTDLRIAARHI